MLTLNASGILVEWDEPVLPNGELQYNITLTAMDLARAESELVEYMAVTTERSQFFELSSTPHTLYVASVVSVTGAGGGEADIESLQTGEESKL